MAEELTFQHMRCRLGVLVWLMEITDKPHHFALNTHMATWQFAWLVIGVFRHKDNIIPVFFECFVCAFEER